jgi:nascent polypeptide-associated complex subunit alpha
MIPTNPRELEKLLKRMGISEEDIALIMEQTGASREEAIKALIETKGDLVQAAMKLLSQKRQ